MLLMIRRSLLRGSGTSTHYHELGFAALAAVRESAYGPKPIHQ